MGEASFCIDQMPKCNICKKELALLVQSEHFSNISDAIHICM